MKNKKIIPLNLICDYPVKWSRYKVLKDFVQNFYDSLNYNNFHKKFRYEYYKNTILKLISEEISFSYEWLIHIGASSKRDEKQQYAGYFGEGFKMAALCSVRDYNWDICMSADDWSLKVIIKEIEIDGKNIESLAYELTENLNKINYTILEIKNFKWMDFQIFKSSLLSFYYPENPLLGKKIYSTKNSAVYYRSDYEKPEFLPYTKNENENGIIFASFQIEGSIDKDLVLCSHDYKLKDRDRNFFTTIDIINILIKISEDATTKACYELLKHFKKHWYEYPKIQYGHSSFYSIIRKLIMKISKNNYFKNKFKKEFPDLIVCEKINSNDIIKKNKRNLANAWLNSLDKKYKFVQDNFTKLGYMTIEDFCDSQNASVSERFPTDKEKKYITILQNCTKELFDDFFELTDFPVLKIIINSETALTGLSDVILKKKRIKNKYKLIIRYNIKKIYLIYNLFEKGMFNNALSTFLHELCHIFGGDKSANFSNVLTVILSVVVGNTNLIQKYESEWNKIE